MSGKSKALFPLVSYNSKRTENIRHEYMHTWTMTLIAFNIKTFYVHSASARCPELIYAVNCFGFPYAVKHLKILQKLQTATSSRQLNDPQQNSFPTKFFVALQPTSEHISVVYRTLFVFLFIL